MEYLVVVALVWAVLAGVGGWIGGQTGRGVGEGLILGLLLGPIGWLIALLLPRPEEIRPRRREPRPVKLTHEDVREILHEQQQDDEVAEWLRGARGQ